VSGNSELPDPLRQVKPISLLRVNINDDAQITVCGFGLLFSNPGHESDAWINRSAPISGGLDLVSLLRRRTFVILVNRTVPVTKMDLHVIWPPFQFLYDENFDDFDVTRLGNMVEANMVR
jgi:hypothetical protein